MIVEAFHRKCLLAGRLLLLTTALLAGSGCVLQATGREGTRHYVVLGVGIVSISAPEAAAPVTVAKVQALGAVAELSPSARVTLGYINSRVVEVDANTHSTVELSDAIGGPLKVSTLTSDSKEQEP